MREQFREITFKGDRERMLEAVKSVVEEYALREIKLTLRQLYYQLVAKTIIPNSLREYSKLSGLLTDARYAGLVDWGAIEDRVRVPKRPPEFADLNELMEAAKNSFRLPRWEGQKYYVELFTEKDALSSVLQPIAEKYHVVFSVNRGYSSATAMYDAGKRFLEAAGKRADSGEWEKDCILLYIGDHDPSGLDMVRDIQSRLVEFGAPVEVEHIALTTEQVKQFSPPPNPAKFSDPRASGYVQRFGKTSWEVDALPPDALEKVVSTAILKYLDGKLMKTVMEREEVQMERLEEAAKKIADEDEEEQK
jgi:hypothetical protein